ncbi:MAG: DUF4249 family protein [Bacteroidetes bacterium]|nr:MAG: DUF4249 family protein [Bacteroidota bacterium]
MRSLAGAVATICLCVMASCSEEVKVFAPEKNIWAVYGALDPEADTQIVRVSRVFQVRSDAYTYAAGQDVSARGLKVALTGGGLLLTATEVPDSPIDTSSGDFAPFTTLYKIATRDSNRLLPGQRYELHISDEQRPGWQLAAHTTLPPRPRINLPLLTIRQGEKCLSFLPVKDSFQVLFTPNPQRLPVTAYRYEIRIDIAYYRADGSPALYRYGPTPLFAGSRGCASGAGNALCYEFRDGQVLDAMRANLLREEAGYSYESEPRCGGIFDDLSESLLVRVTAVDTFLAQYMLANDPRTLNFNDVRREYSNIRGTEEAVGVFGSFSGTSVPAGIDACAEYLLGLRVEKPFGCVP